MLGIVNHLPSCKGNLECAKCGRRMCSGCSSIDSNGECLICRGIYKEDGIILHLIPNKGWDK